MICARHSTLAKYFEEVYLPQRLVCASADTIEHYRLALKHWAAVHPSLKIQHITSRHIAEFQQYLANGRSAASVNSYTRPIKAILRFAAEDEEQVLLGQLPKIRMVHERRNSPLALTIEEFSKILARVAALSGQMCGYPAADWWTAVLLTAWETGLRMRALISLRTVDLLWEDQGIFSQADVAKDREAAWFSLQPATLEAIKKIYDPMRELLFPRTLAMSTIGKKFRGILDTSGIYAPRGAGMCFHRIRRSKASYTELAGGDAQRALGHSSRSVTERYLDPRIVGRINQPMMPLPQLF